MIKNDNIRAKFKFGGSFMVRSIVRYVGLTVIVIGIVLLVSNLLNSNNREFKSNKNNDIVKYYSVSIKVLDKETKKFLNGGSFVLKDNEGKIIEEWEQTENIKRIGKLKKGTYVIEQKSSLDGYEMSDKLTFRISNSDKNIDIYNTVIQEVMSESEVSVDNTLSLKSSFGYVVSIIISCIGIILILNKRDNFS